jgi:hypothetical protein
MFTKKSTVNTGLILCICVVLVAGVAWAKTTKHKVWGTFEYGGTGAPGAIWSDGDILHLEAIPYILYSTSGNISIELDGICNHIRNTVTNNGVFWGSDHSLLVTFTDRYGNERSGVFHGSHSGDYIALEGPSNHYYFGIGGDFIGWTLILDGYFDFRPESINPDTGFKPGSFKGVLQQPKVFVLGL